MMERLRYEIRNLFLLFRSSIQLEYFSGRINNVVRVIEDGNQNGVITFFK
jgi:hypothetical protein